MQTDKRAIDLRDVQLFKESEYNPGMLCRVLVNLFVGS